MEGDVKGRICRIFELQSTEAAFWLCASLEDFIMKLFQSILFHQLDDVVESELTLQLMLVIQSRGHLYSN